MSKIVWGQKEYHLLVGLGQEWVKGGSFLTFFCLRGLPLMSKIVWRQIEYHLLVGLGQEGVKS